jgi:hypothetical protein
MAIAITGPCLDTRVGRIGTTRLHGLRHTADVDRRAGRSEGLREINTDDAWETWRNHRPSPPLPDLPARYRRT